jgi:hypothetical protein
MAVRVDSTVTAALIHEPSDSSLRWEAVRVIVRRCHEQTPGLVEDPQLLGAVGEGTQAKRDVDALPHKVDAVRHPSMM